jgi:hypothetical protein
VAALTLFMVGAWPGGVAAGVNPWSGGAMQERAGIAAPSLGAPWPVSASTARFMPGNRSESGDTMMRLASGMRDRITPFSGRRAATGILAFVGQVSSVCDFGRGYVKHVMNPRAFGFQLHFDVAASLRHPGNGFVISRRF